MPRRAHCEVLDAPALAAYKKQATHPLEIAINTTQPKQGIELRYRKENDGRYQITNPLYRIPAKVHLRADRNENECTHCQKGDGPLRHCRSMDKNFWDGACTNCAWGGNWHRCSFNTSASRPAKGGTKKRKQSLSSSSSVLDDGPTQTQPAKRTKIQEIKKTILAPARPKQFATKTPGRVERRAATPSPTRKRASPTVEVPRATRANRRPGKLPPPLKDATALQPITAPQPATAPQPIAALQPTTAPQPIAALQPTTTPQPITAPQPATAPQSTTALQPTTTSQPIATPQPTATGNIEVEQSIAAPLKNVGYTTERSTRSTRHRPSLKRHTIYNPGVNTRDADSLRRQARELRAQAWSNIRRARDLERARHVRAWSNDTDSEVDMDKIDDSSGLSDPPTDRHSGNKRQKRGQPQDKQQEGSQPQDKRPQDKQPQDKQPQDKRPQDRQLSDLTGDTLKSSGDRRAAGLDPQEDTPTPMERGVRRNQRLDMQRGHATNRARPAGDVLSETVTTQPAPQGLEASALALQRLAGHGPNIDIGTDPLAQMHAANARSRRRRALQRIAENRVALSLDTSIHPTPSAATSRPVQSPSMAATELAHQNTPGATMHSGPTGPDDTMARRRDASRMLVTSLTEWARQFDSRESLQAAISSIRDLSPSSKIEIEYLLELRQSGQASEAPLQPQVTATTESTVQGGATVTTSSGPMDTVGQQVPPDQDTQLVQQQRSLFYSRATTTRPESVRTPSPQTAPQGGLSSGHEAQAYAENEKGWVRNATEGTIQDEELTRDIVQTMLAMRSDPETLTEFMALLPPPTGTGPHYSAQGPTAEPSTPTAGQALLAGIHQASGAKTTEQPRQKKSKRVTGSFSPEWTVHE